MSGSRLVRGAKTRMFACVCFLSVLGALLYVFHGTQTRLADVQKLSNNCNQQLESLSAQLQVIFEYKLRLEKSLKKEKADHQTLKETCKNKEKEDKDARDKEKTEAKNKYDALVQNCKMQKSQCDDDRESHDKEKTQLENSLESIKEKMKSKETELQQLNTKYIELEEELKKQKELNDDLAKNADDEKVNKLQKQTVQLNTDLRTVKNSLDECKLKLGKEQEKEDRAGAGAENAPDLPKPENTNALEPPRVNSMATSNSSTTPGINPDAVSNQDLSSPKPSIAEKKDDQVIPTPKRSTQESGARLQENAGPLAAPSEDNLSRRLGGGARAGGGSLMLDAPLMNNILLNPPQSVDQIPLPPKPPSFNDPIKKPEIQPRQHHTDNQPNNNIQWGPLNPVAEAEEGVKGNSNMAWAGVGGGERGLEVDRNEEDNEDQIHQQQHQINNNNNMDHNNAIEDLEEPEPHQFHRQRENPEIPRQGKPHPGDYHGGDYDKEPPEEEEDDEGEQMDYVQAANNEQANRKEDESKHNVVQLQRMRHAEDNNGIMVNPK